MFNKKEEKLMEEQWEKLRKYTLLYQYEQIGNAFRKLLKEISKDIYLLEITEWLEKKLSRGHL